MPERYIIRAREIIAPRIAERQVSLEKERGKTISSLNARGLLRSGAFILAINELAANELRIRIRLVYVILVDVLTRLRVAYSDTLFNELLHEVETHAKENRHWLEQYISSPTGTEVNVLPELFDPAYNNSVAEIRGQLGVLCDQLQHASSSPGREANVFTFNAPVGAVQTGAGAVANVVQNLGEGDKETVRRALDLVEAALQSHSNARDLIAMAGEAREELTKAEPNNTKLMTILQTLGTTVQAIPAGQHAYEAIRAALLPWGLAV